jgi:hypothetical protein
MGPGVCFIMAPVKKTTALLLLLISGTALANSTLDIGTSYRMRGISMSKTDYGLTSDQNYSYYSQRALAHIGGRFSPNIEFMMQFQALSMAGSSGTVTNPIANPSGNRYPNTNFTPWIQTASMKASQLYDLPLDLTLGRQPITLGDGFILSDDDLGFTGIRLESRLPWYGLQGQLFTFKTGDGLQGSKNSDIYGIELTKPTRNIRYQLSVVSEHDNMGTTPYIRPSENAAGVPVSDYIASNITRTFYDARIEGRLLEGGFYKGEVAIQRGSVDRSSATLGNVSLGGYAALISAGLFTRFSKYGPIEIHGLFGLASGDAGGGTDNSFRPSYGHKYDGLERSGFGEFYGATLYDAIPSNSYGQTSSSPSVSGLPQGHSGIRVIGAGVTTHPTSLLSIGIDYFVYTSQESTTFSTAPSESSLGTELDIGAGFAYTNFMTFRASIAFFSPGKAYGAFQENAQKISIEAVGHF